MPTRTLLILRPPGRGGAGTPRSAGVEDRLLSALAALGIPPGDLTPSGLSR